MAQYHSDEMRTARRKSSVSALECAEQQDICSRMFDCWSESEQVEFVENLLTRMCHHQHGQIDEFLKPMLQCNFISSLPGKYCD